MARSLWEIEGREHYRLFSKTDLIFLYNSMYEMKAKTGAREVVPVPGMRQTLAKRTALLRPIR